MPASIQSEAGLRRGGDKALSFVLTIDSGDIVTIATATNSDPSVIDQSGVVPPSTVPQYVRDIFRDVRDRGPGPHILTRPIEIGGAMPGDVLEVRILDVDFAISYGYNRQRPYAVTTPAASIRPIHG